MEFTGIIFYDWKLMGSIRRSQSIVTYSTNPIRRSLGEDPMVNYSTSNNRNINYKITMNNMITIMIIL